VLQQWYCVYRVDHRELLRLYLHRLG
jgi:hypothetical protein